MTSVQGISMSYYSKYGCNREHQTSPDRQKLQGWVQRALDKPRTMLRSEQISVQFLTRSFRLAVAKLNWCLL